MMKVIYDRRSVGQSTDGGSNFCCSSSSPSLTPSLASALAVAAESLFSKQGQTGDRASPPSCLANVTIANSAPIYDRPGDHGEHQSQWFKFTNNQLTGRVYHARSLSSLISSPSPSSPSSSSSSSLSLSLAISGTALARSNTDNSNARNCLPLANHDKNNDSSSSPTPPLSSLSSSSPSSSSPPPPSAPSTAPSLSGAATVPSLRGLPPRSCRKISAKGAPPRPHELVGVLGSPSHSSRPPLGPKTRTPTVAHIIPDRLSRGAISLTAVLIVVVQLCQVLLSTPLVSMASAQIRVSNGDLKPAVTNNLQAGSLVGGDQPNTAGLSAAMRTMPPDESWRSGPESMRDLREARPLADKLPVNMTNVFQVLFKKKPYSKYWTVEQKWDDLFKRGIAVQETMRQAMLKNFMRDIEYYADMTISPPCERDLKYIQSYTRQSTNFRWLAHMFDSTGKSEPGMLTGMLSNLGHPVQCIRVRAPGRPSNDSFDERFFEQQTRALGERFRGKYCLASLRPVLPPKPANIVVSRFSEIMNVSMLSNISYTGEPEAKIKQRARQMHVPASVYSKIDRDHLRLDQVPFESELYEYLIAQRNFVFSLPRFMGACYPSSCSREDIRMSIQRTMDDQHQVVDIEFECEQEEINPWDWFTTPRLVAYVILGLICGMVFLASLARYILLSKLQIKRSRLAPNSGLGSLLDALDMFSIDKCAGILFVKTKPASPWVDWTKVENNRSTSIDALRGFLILILVYSQLTLLGCLPVPFMWSKWSDAMFPFYRSMVTQLFINTNIWSEAFYMISAYIIALKVLENHRPKPVLLVGAGGQHFANSINNLRPSSKQAGTNLSGSQQIYQAPNLFSFAMKRYVRLVLPMAAFILFNYVWPRLSNGFVMQDQASKLMKPCDSFGWTNFILLHNHNQLNETCLWPSHVSANFFQLHLLSYPLLVLCLMALYSQFKVHYGDYDENKRRKKFIAKLLICLVYGALILLGLVGAIYPALQASGRSLIVPFLIDYLDFDNYRRVIEWMVMPTYNHLTSYMFGLGIAFVVIRRRANRELHRMQASQWGFDGALGHYNQREGSVESIRSSSTQELHQSDGLTFKQSPFGINSAGLPASIRPIDGQQIHQRQFNISSGSSGSASEKRYDDDNNDDDSLEESASSNCYLSFAKTSLCIILCLGSLLASWFWNGLGQPMSDEQTFWYVMLTKLVFCSSFAYLFHQQFATRRNSSNPWMITRFLVPIGRMSLTVFYMGWLVIWFDLLASLYQWHPSHYFVCEKYNEIIFITLIVSMFVYAAFEGIVKRLQYSSRAARLRRDIELSTTNPTLDVVGGLVGGSERSRRQMKPFESFFDPSDKPTLSELKEELKLNESTSGAGNSGSSKPADAKNQSSSLTDNTNKLNTIDAMKQQQQIAVVVHQSNYQGDTKPVYLRSTGDVSTISGGGGGGGGAGNLSPSDRYKLNAELRANYSFASIGLYESAGATGDLSHQQQTSDPNDKRR